MALLKEDGSLDIERINKLPYEDFVDEIRNMTDGQYNEFISKLPLNESYEPTEIMYVDYTMEEDVEKNGLVNADDFFSKIRNKHNMK